MNETPIIEVPARIETEEPKPLEVEEAGPKWTKSQVQKISRRVIGPLARVWFRDGVYKIGLQSGASTLVLGSGATPQEAFDATFVKPLQARERLREEQEAAEQAKGISLSTEP